MPLTAARASDLTDVSELAARCAGCFCRARCAGCDLKAIRPVAEGALRLGAQMDQLAATAPPYATDADYLAELAEIAAACADQSRYLDSLTVQLREGIRASRAAMAAALRCRPRDWPAYYDAMRAHHYYSQALSECEQVLSRLAKTIRLLMTARYEFGSVYEEPETFVARGGALPHEGRWITGQPA